MNHFLVDNYDVNTCGIRAASAVTMLQGQSSNNPCIQHSWSPQQQHLLHWIDSGDKDIVKLTNQASLQCIPEGKIKKAESLGNGHPTQLVQFQLDH